MARRDRGAAPLFHLFAPLFRRLAHARSMNEHLRLGRRACYPDRCCTCARRRPPRKSLRKTMHVVPVAGTVSSMSRRRYTISLEFLSFTHLDRDIYTHTYMYIHHNHVHDARKKDLCVERVRARARSQPARVPPSRPPRAPSGAVDSPYLRRESNESSAPGGQRRRQAAQ